MKYRNAKELLPEELLVEIQKYVNGELLYIPQGCAKRKGWGETSGIKSMLSSRNAVIRSKKMNGSSISELAYEYNLSYDTIKKIIYRKI
ncbi:CD3324 family protein [Anaeromicropila herbilytica]|uniref:Mor transcription activator domain-containing protein n=1 Tax=Anaeromicropila herbilytica TaxID=2785025 RepID=A0A7R7ICE2_9FIRM|nr:CD3324 family protein [Anaeromicropila herbilytica]BCN29824.1 hypothetical protein bsdtb5_11190 [Anaeromicropila herbilytica]